MLSLLPIYDYHMRQGYTVFTFVCLTVSVSVSTQWAEWRIGYCLPRNVFDSCVKSGHYFCTDKILLETSFYCLSVDIVRFKIKVGVYEKCTKM